MLNRIKKPNLKLIYWKKIIFKASCFSLVETRVCNELTTTHGITSGITKTAFLLKDGLVDTEEILNRFPRVYGKKYSHLTFLEIAVSFKVLKGVLQIISEYRNTS